jgi:hypothetical protein
VTLFSTFCSCFRVLSLILVLCRWRRTKYWLFLDRREHASFTSKYYLYQFSYSCCKKSVLFQGNSDNLLNCVHSVISLLKSLIRFMIHSFSQMAWKNQIRGTQHLGLLIQVIWWFMWTRSSASYSWSRLAIAVVLLFPLV